ncbi:MAG: hypothetical protein SGPRY_011487 [Prymnesium sp.]
MEESSLKLGKGNFVSVGGGYPKVIRRVGSFRDSDPRSIVLLVASVAIFGTTNSFSSRMRAQAFGATNYIVTLYNALLQTLVYLVAYLVLTALGKLPSGQLSCLFKCEGWRWSQLGLGKYLVLAALAEMADGVTGYTAEPHLTTLTYALMNQATVPFTVLFTIIFLRKLYIALELLSVLVVVSAAAGCVLLSASPGGERDSIGWGLFAASTTSFAAIGFLLKETTFRNFTRPPPGLAVGSLNDQLLTKPVFEELSFVTVGVVTNALGIVASLPIVWLNEAFLTAALGQTQPPVEEAIACLVACENALATFAFYELTNLLWNAALLCLTAYGSALHAFLALKLVVPCVALLSFLDWPLIGSHPTSPIQWVALLVMGAGITGYQWGNAIKHRGAVDIGEPPVMIVRSHSCT